MDDQNISSHKGMNKAVVATICAIVIAVSVVFLLVRHKNKEIINKIPNSNSELPPGYAIIQSKAEQLPEKFPADFPLEGGAVVDNGYNVFSPSNFQSTVHFESKKTLTQNLKIYSAYLSKASGWRIKNTLDLPTIKSVFAENAKGTTVLVSIAQNMMTKVSQVTISFVYGKEANN